MTLPIENTKAVPKDAPNSDFAFVDEKGEQHLYIGDKQHAIDAAMAVTEGLEGNKFTAAPDDKMPGIKKKIASALRKFITDKDELQNWLDKLDGKGDSKAIVQHVSEDGDDFKIGDTVTFQYYGYGDNTTGSAYIGVIRAIAGNRASVEPYSSDMQPNGNILSIPLSDLREYTIPGMGDDDSKSAKAVVPNVIDMATITVKAIGEDRIGGYAVIFDSRDLTPYKNPDGSKGEYFTKATDFALDWYTIRPAIYHHGQDNKTAATLIATIDKIEVDDNGVWVEAQLNKRNAYIKQVKELVDKGAVGWSTGSLNYLVKKAPDGRIERWPICEVSITPTPAEPRTLAQPIKHFVETHLQVTEACFKSLNLPTDRLTPPQEAENVGAKDGANLGNAARTKTPTPTPPGLTFRKTDGTKMELSEQQLAALVAEAVQKQKNEEAAALKAQQEAAELESLRKFKQEAEAAAKAAPANNPTKSLNSNGTTGTLPQPQPTTQPAKPNTVDARVIGEVKYADLSAEDLAYMVSVYGAYAAKGMQRVAYNPLSGRENLTNQEKTALDFFEQARKDGDRKFEREVSAKALRELNQHRIPEGLLSYLPYKSLDAVDANEYNEKAVEAAIKANELDNSAQTGFGLEWVPTIWNANLWRRVRITNPVLANMVAIDMPSNPFNLTLESTDPTAYFIGEATDLTMLTFGSGSTFTTSKVASNKKAITAYKQGVRIGFSAELQEDSIIPVLPTYRYQAERVLLNTVDDTIINGDTATGASTNVNLIDSTPAGGTSYLAFDGIRKYALVTNTAQAIDFGGGAPTLALFRKMRATMGRSYIVDIKNLVYVVAPEVYMKMINMPEYSTWQQLGQPGANQTGLLPGGSTDLVGMGLNDPAFPVGYIDGVPVYVSAQLTNAQSNGKISNTGSNNTLGSAVLYHRTRWYVGYRRHIQIDVLTPNAMPLSDTYQVWATIRYGLQSFDTASAVVGYDILV